LEDGEPSLGRVRHNIRIPRHFRYQHRRGNAPLSSGNCAVIIHAKLAAQAFSWYFLVIQRISDHAREYAVEQEIIPAKYDFIFKWLFGDRNHIKPLTHLLMAVLGLPAEDFKTLTFGDPNLYPRYREGKRFVLDLKLEIASGKLFVIEVQLADTGEIRQRIAAYESRLLGDRFAGGDDYKELNKVITILITDFVIAHRGLENL
jgi:hypothetical protein